VGGEKPLACPIAPDAPANEWWWPTAPRAPALGPPPPPPIDPMVPPDDPAAVQKTLATIWDGVMPTTGTLALG